MDWKKDIKMKDIVKDWDKKRELIILVLVNWAIIYILGNQLGYIWNETAYRVCGYLFKIAKIIPGVIYFIKHKKSFKKLFIINSPWEIVIGILMAVFITTVIGIASAITGNGSYIHLSVNPFKYVDLFIYYIFLTGFREEFTYRMVIQDSINENLKDRNRKFAPLISAVIFSISHIFQGTPLQAVITFFTGLIFGYALQYIKKCSYISVSIGHGLYDFMVVIFGIDFR